MATFRIAVLAGDGIGREVIDEGLRVLRAIERRTGTGFHFIDLPAGAGEYLATGDPLPAGTFEACTRADAILLGAMGLPDVRWPDGREMAPQLDLRERLNLYAGVRPARLFHRSHSPLKSANVDLVIFRESTEGLFSSRNRAADLAADRETDTLLVTRTTSERLFRAAFKEARRRRGLLTLVDKANVLPSMVYFRSIFDEIAREFPQVRTEHVYVDAAALYLVRSPERFDVMVMENMFGDILSDLAAATVGGMGMAPSADIGDEHAVFQPAHGSAPDIAGRGIANPVATILSVAMMLDWLGAGENGAIVRQAVSTVLKDPANATADLGGRLSTSELGAKIAAAL
jgi:3-isopropylmalate dehydrogenase